MKKLKYFLSLIILFLFLFFENKVFALSINVEDNSNSKNTVNSEINMSKTSWFSVTIPKNIVIDGSKKNIYTQNYEITVKGDLSGHETIYVIPEDNFKLKDTTGLKEVTCHVSQNKNSFTIPSVGILDEKTEGTVRTSNIEAGFYSGDFNFEIYKEIISNHTFGDWFTYLEPTCTEKGISRKVCSICNGYEEKDINALGHDWDSQKDENGYYIQRCKRNNSHIKNNGVVTYTISYTLNKGTISGQKTSYNVETDGFTIPTPTRSGYTFKGWSGTGLSGDTNKTVTVSKGSTGNKTYTANWIQNVNYKVIHQQEQLDGTYKEFETQTFTGPIGSKVKPAVKTYTGFNSPSTAEITITSDGKASVTYKYSRKTYTVTCQDWIVDKNNNKKADVTSNIPLSTDSKYSSRTTTVKYGATINASEWGSQTGRSKYASNYGYVGSNGNITVTGAVTVYRYFHQTFDVNMTLDGTSNATGKDGDKIIGTFDVYIDGTLVSNDVCDYCALQPYGVSIELKDFKANTGYKYKGNSSITGTMGATTLVLAPAYVKTYNVTTQYSEGIQKVTGAGYYEKGATVTLEATVYDCATWVNWTGNSTNTNKKFTFTMPANAVTYKANAKPNSSSTSHSWKVAATQAATCETDSVESQVCTKCGLTKTTHNTPKTGHKADTSKDKITAATCTKQGFTTHTCKTCGKTWVDTYVNALGHNYNSSGVCTRCGDFDINKLSAGLYTMSTSNGKTTYATKYTWQQLLDKGIFSVNSSGLLVLGGVNTTTGASPHRAEFDNCFLVLADTVKQVNSNSFYNCQNLKGIYISKNVNTFYTGWNNYNVENIYLSKDNPNFTLENGALYSKDGKTLWYAVKKGSSSISIKNGCTTIMSSAVAFSSYSSISIPNTVTKIESSAFRNSNNLTSLYIPASATNVSSSFACCCSNLQTINVDSSNPSYTSLDGVMYTKDMKTLMSCGAGKSGALNIPSTVTVISANSVDGCSKITSVSIPNTVTSIGNWAFSGCSSITSIKLPDNDNYTTINVGAFSNCGGTEVIIPKNISVINRSNFRNSRTTKVTFADTSRQWKLSLQDNGTAVSGVPTSAFSVSNAAQNITYFRTYQYYKWTRQ